MEPAFLRNVKRVTSPIYEGLNTIAHLPRIAPAMDDTTLSTQLLPSVTLTVQEFLAYKLPSVAPNIRFTRPNKYLSILEPNVDDVEEFAKLTLPPSGVLDSLREMDKSGARSIICPHETSAGGKRYPMWLLTYWLQVKDVRGVQCQWRSAVSNLHERIKEKDNQSSELVQTVDTVVSHLPWAGEIPGFNTKTDMRFISFYLTTQWLTDDHESLMLELLRRETEQLEGVHINFQDPFFIPLLCAAYDNRSNYGTDSSYQWLRDLGTDLGSHYHSHLVTISNINQNHWGAIIVDFDQKLVQYGDSMDRLVKAGVKSALNWWLYIHTGQGFAYTKLPTTRQEDSHSCGILAWNAIAHYFFPKRHPLMDASRMRDERLQILLKILGYSKPEFHVVS